METPKSPHSALSPKGLMEIPPSSQIFFALSTHCICILTLSHMMSPYSPPGVAPPTKSLAQHHAVPGVPALHALMPPYSSVDWNSLTPHSLVHFSNDPCRRAPIA